MKALDLGSKEGFKRLIERYSPKQGVIDYAFICSLKKYSVRLHYLEEQKRTIHCFGGECCNGGHKTNDYVIYLLGVYTDYKDPEAPIDFQYLRATKSVDSTITALIEQFDDPKQICNIDLQLYLDTDAGAQFKKIGITPCVAGNRKATKAQIADLKKRMSEVMDKLKTEIADEVTETEYLKIMRSQTSAIPVAPIPKVATTPKIQVPAKEPSAVPAEPVEIEVDLTDLDDLI